jgi:hypothetical protein
LSLLERRLAYTGKYNRIQEHTIHNHTHAGVSFGAFEHTAHLEKMRRIVS